jgi:asparagine synthase (glutamine-hydrolysing)
MCGISGFISFKNSYTETDLQTMNNLLAHRGPNAEGHFFDGVCGLGHRRLSIIDLSENANQPMHSSNDRYVITFNGEIYNFQEIGAKLSGMTDCPPVKFKTTSDTEVILEAFASYGTEFVHLLNGMFAIAIWDKKEQELYLFRDRSGIKPLYYYYKDEELVFASELKAIRKINRFDYTVNPEAVPEFLHMGFIASPRTIYKYCFKVPPGHFIKFSRNGKEIHNYWKLNSKIQRNIITSEEEAIHKLSDLLISSVEYQLRADVPTGVFLSGGIDSSLLTALAVKLSPAQVTTFSIGFEEKRFNELHHAHAISKHLHTNHHELIVSYKDALELLSTGMEIYDEPHADSSILPTMIVSRLARKHVTVALSGDGGDELFLGYGTYQWAARMSNPFLRTFHKPISIILSKMSSRYKRFGKMIDISNIRNIRSHIFSQEQYYFSAAEIDSILEPTYRQSGFWHKLDDMETLTSTLGESGRQLNSMEKQSFFDLLYYLPEDLLTKVDRASMHYSLEARVPLLDHRLIEFALNLSPDLKVKGRTTKYLLKKILHEYVPADLFDRPKQGFSIPMTKWLRNELSVMQETYLNSDFVKRCGFVNPEKVAGLRQSFMQGNDHLFMRVWQLICLHKWAADQGLERP